MPADVHHAAELAGAHAVEGQLAEVEATAEVRVDHGIPHVAGHLAHGAVARDAGVVDQDLDRVVLFGDLMDGGFAGREITGVELHRGDPRRLGEGLCGRVVAGVACHDIAPGRLQRNADRRADSACSARHQCYARHYFLPGLCRCILSRFAGGRQTAFRRRRPAPVSVRRRAPRPCRRRCTAWRGLFSHRAGPSRAAASPAPGRRKRRSDGRSRWPRR